MQTKAGSKQPVVLALAVAGVAEDRQRGVLAVAADLVGAAGLGPGLDPRVAARPLRRLLTLVGAKLAVGEPTQVGERGQAGAVVFDVDPAQRMIDAQLLGREPADQREVALADLAALELIAGVAGRLGVEREEQHARGRAIEPMDRVHARADQRVDLLDRDDLVARPAAVDQEPARLGDREQAIVAVDDLPGLERFGFGRVGIGIGRVELAHFGSLTWRPHSFCSASSHHQRPSRSCWPGMIARVQGSQPMLISPRSCSGL